MQSVKLQFKSFYRRVGFTLIEILVAVALVGVITGVGVQAVSSILGSYSKSKLINTLQGEGARTMQEMVRVIRASVRAAPCASCSELVLTIDENSIEWDAVNQCRQVRFDLFVPGGGANKYIRRRDLDCVGVISEAIITDNSQSGVDVASLLFNVVSSAGVPDRVKIDLTLQQPQGLPGDPIYATQVSLQRVVTTRQY